MLIILGRVDIPAQGQRNVTNEHAFKLQLNVVKNTDIFIPPRELTNYEDCIVHKILDTCNSIWIPRLIGLTFF